MRNGTMTFAVLAAAGALAVVRPASGGTSATVESSADTVSFAEQIAPILEKRCVRCHGATIDGERRTELSLDLTSYKGIVTGSEYGEVIIAGDPDESLLVEMIEAGDMPEEGDPVTDEELEIIRRWIAEGAQNN